MECRRSRLDKCWEGLGRKSVSEGEAEREKPSEIILQMLIDVCTS